MCPFSYKERQHWYGDKPYKLQKVPVAPGGFEQGPVVSVSESYDLETEIGEKRDSDSPAEPERNRIDIVKRAGIRLFAE